MPTDEPRTDTVGDGLTPLDKDMAMVELDHVGEEEDEEDAELPLHPVALDAAFARAAAAQEEAERKARLGAAEPRPSDLVLSGRGASSPPTIPGPGDVVTDI